MRMFVLFDGEFDFEKELTAAPKRGKPLAKPPWAGEQINDRNRHRARCYWQAPEIPASTGSDRPLSRETPRKSYGVAGRNFSNSFGRTAQNSVSDIE